VVADIHVFCLLNKLNIEKISLYNNKYLEENEYESTRGNSDLNSRFIVIGIIVNINT
jgi:hypothetical protein